MGPPNALSSPLGMPLTLLPLYPDWGNQSAGTGLKAGRAAGCMQPSLATGSCPSGAGIPKELNHASN